MVTPSTDSRFDGLCSRVCAPDAGICSRQLVEAMPALAGGDKTLPVGDREIDRRQRPRAQDRAGDDDAGGRFLVNHQIGTDAEHGRLQHHAQHLGGPRRDRRRRRWRADCRPDRFRWPRSSAWSAGRTSPSRPALRRCAGWWRRDRCGSAASVIASRAGWRDMNSVIKVSVTRIRAPIKAVVPSSQWNAKQIAR